MLRTFVALSLLAGCKKKPQEDQVPPLPLPSVETKLTLVSVSPSRVNPNTPAPVRVFGSGFARGITVEVADTPATAVTWVGDNQLDVVLPALAAGSWDLVATNPDGSRATLRAGVQVAFQGNAGAACDFVVLYFETDAAGLTPAAETTLASLVPCYEEASEPVNIAGHADERGTTDYNVALSYRRALSVRDFLVSSGVAPGRLPVTSFGEERPADPASSQTAWAKNRRVELAFD